MKDKNLKMGILCILLSAIGFSLMSFFVKLAGDLPVLQKAFFRNLIAGIVSMIPILSHIKYLVLPQNKKDWSILFLRSFIGTLGLICNFYAVSHINLADASVIQRLSPFIIIILCYFAFKEKVSKVQLLAIVIAFFGVILVIKPSLNLVSTIGSFVALLGSIFAGIAYTCVRYLGKKNISADFIVLFFSIFSCLFTLPSTIMDYKPMTIKQWLMLIMVGITGAVGQFGVTYAYRFSSANNISVFDYTQIIFAGLLGYVFFFEIPDIYSLLGYVLIVCMGILITFNEKSTS